MTHLDAHQYTPAGAVRSGLLWWRADILLVAFPLPLPLVNKPTRKFRRENQHNGYVLGLPMAKIYSALYHCEKLLIPVRNFGNIFPARFWKTRNSEGTIRVYTVHDILKLLKYPFIYLRSDHSVISKIFIFWQNFLILCSYHLCNDTF